MRELRGRAGFLAGMGAVVEHLADTDAEESGDLLNQLQAGIACLPFVVDDAVTRHAQLLPEFALRQALGDAECGHALAELGGGFCGGTSSGHRPMIAWLWDQGLHVVVIMPQHSRGWKPQKCFGTAERRPLVPRIPEAELEGIKRGTDLAALVRAKGIELRPHGGGHLAGKCPFHEDSTPSFIVTVSGGLKEGQ